MKVILVTNTTQACILVVFENIFFDESALSFFEVLTSPIHKCNEDRPDYATQYQDIFDQYQEGFNFVTSKASVEFKDVHLTIPNGAPSLIPYIEADILYGYFIPQESPVYHKLEQFELLRKQNRYTQMYR